MERMEKAGEDVQRRCDESLFIGFSSESTELESKSKTMIQQI